MSNFAPRLQPSLLDEARKLAAADGVALNQFINVAVAEELSAMRNESYFAERAARADIPKAVDILKMPVSATHRTRATSFRKFSLL